LKQVKVQLCHAQEELALHCEISSNEKHASSRKVLSMQSQVHYLLGKKVSKEVTQF